MISITNINKNIWNICLTFVAAYIKTNNMENQSLKQKHSNEGQVNRLSRNTKKSLLIAYATLGGLAILSAVTFINNQMYFKEVIGASIVISCLLFLRIQELRNS